MLSIERTPLSTRLLNGHDTNSLFGSSKTTSIDGSASRTYLAAVAPPQPPPITTTRRPGFCAKSETLGAHPAASRPRPIPDVPRNSLRVQSLMRASVESDGAEAAGRFVPGRKHSPPERDRDDQRDSAAPAERGRQEDRRPELLEEPGLRRDQSGEGRADGEARDGGPELHLALAGAPERAGAAPARERHPHAEGESAGERAEPGGREHPLALVLEVGEFQDREPEHRHDERQRRRPRVLGVARHERLAKGTHQAEARALEDHAEGDAEE